MTRIQDIIDSSVSYSCNIKVSNSQKRRLFAGFTLIELLVVIAIISLLVSILLPSLNKAKELAKRAVCSSNLHNIGLSLALYANDFNGDYPQRSPSNLVNWTVIDHWRAADFWKDYIPDYNSVLFCPNVSIDDWEPAWKPDGWATDTRIPYPTLSGCAYWFDDKRDTSDTYASLADLIADGSDSNSRSIIMTDAVINRPGVTHIFYQSNHPQGSFVENGTCVGGNVLLNDSSVNWMSFDDFDGTMSYYYYPTNP